MNKAQQKFGQPSAFIKAKPTNSVMDPVVQEFISKSPFAVLSTSNVHGDCDASPKGGQPGFVKVLDQSTLLIPDVAGNKLFQSYENIETNPKAALIFMIPGCGLTVRVNGRVRTVGREDVELRNIDAEVFSPDANAKILQGLILEVDEVYPHCPRAFAFSSLWDVDTIQRNLETSSEKHWFKKWSGTKSAP